MGGFQCLACIGATRYGADGERGVEVDEIGLKGNGRVWIEQK